MIKHFESTWLDMTIKIEIIKSKRFNDSFRAIKCK